MTNRDTGLLTFRALAVYAAIRAIDQAGEIIGMGIYKTEILWEVVLAEMFIPPFLLFGSAGLLWFFAPKLTQKAFVNASDSEGAAATFGDIKALVFSAIGIALLVLTIPNVLKSIFLIFATTAFDSYDKELVSQRNYQVCLTVIRLIIGFWLFFGTRGVIKLLNKLRRE